ncbi:hypothetical protein HQ563_03195 [bacterium]|nr:hypothetical protein [bacterium]
MTTKIFCRLTQPLVASGAVSILLQGLAAAFALAAAVVGILHFAFAGRRAREGFIHRLRRACGSLHRIRNPVQRVDREGTLRYNRRDYWERKAQLEDMIVEGEAKLSEQERDLVRWFLDLCEKGLPDKQEERRQYRDEYKDCVQKLEARLGRFTGKEMKSI